mgnify:CR=1 FL=1
MAESDVFVRFGADIGPLEKGVNQASSKLNQITAKSRETANAMAKISLAAAAAGAAIGVKLVSNSLAAIDAQAKLAKQLGTSSASIATLNRAADMSGISMKQIEAGAKNLEVAMGEAAQGTGVAVDTLERLNLTAKDLEGMTLDQKIITVNKALQENIPKAERAAAAADLFGKRAGFAIAQLDAGTISEATRQVEGMGLALSDFDAAKVEAANDAMASIGMAVEGASQQLAIVLAPLLEDMALKFQEAAIETGGFKTQAVDAVNSVAGAIGLMADGIHGADVIISGLGVGFKTLEAVALEVVATIAEYFDSLTQGFTNSINGMIEIANNIPGVNMAELIVGESELVASIRESATEATTALQESMTALHNKMMEPLPSETIEAYIASFTDPAILEAKQAQIDAEKSIEESASLDRIALEEKTQSAMAQIKQSWGKQQTSAVSQMFGDLATLQQSGNKRQFELGKAAARAQTVMSTYEGAQKAYTALAGIPVVGPALGIAAAGAAITAGGIRLQAINSTSFGSGSVSASAAAGGTGGSSASAASVPQAPQAEQSKTLRIEGFDSGQLFTGDQLNSLAEKLVEYQEDGFKLVV